MFKRKWNRVECWSRKEQVQDWCEVRWGISTLSTSCGNNHDMPLGRHCFGSAAVEHSYRSVCLNLFLVGIAYYRARLYFNSTQSWYGAKYPAVIVWCDLFLEFKLDLTLSILSSQPQLAFHSYFPRRASSVEPRKWQHIVPKWGCRTIGFHWRILK